MFVHSKARILFHGEGQEAFLLEAGSLCLVPEWVAKHPDFDVYVRAGRIIIAEGKKESEIEKASIKADFAKAEAQKIHEEKIAAAEEKPAEAEKPAKEEKPKAKKAAPKAKKSK